MKTRRVMQSTVAAAACAFALVVAVGCAASTGSGSASSASASSAASSASASVEASSAAASSASQQAGSASSASSAAGTTGQMTEAEAAAQGYQVFKGTMHVTDAAGVIALQGADIDPSLVEAPGGGTYAVVVFDQQAQVTGQSADGSGQRTEAADVLGVAEHSDYSSFVVEYGDLDACKALDGRQVTIAAKASDIMFPSDVRLPIGQPSASAFIVLS